MNAQGGILGNTLQEALYTGNEKVVQILVDARANINT